MNILEERIQEVKLANLVSCYWPPVVIALILCHFE